MYKYFIILTISFLCFKSNVKATDYAILISAGQATTDNTFSNSEYWYDLYLAYEDLVLHEGYDPANVIVFYGNGTSFNSTRTRYQLALHGWGNIVDFDNNFATMNAEFARLGGVITNNDNLHIRWVVGHGDESGQDNYSAFIQNRNVWITENQIVTMINQITNYNRRKIMWMTCRSGCLAYGTVTLNNNRTVLITSSNWNQDSGAYFLPGETIHAEFNYVTTSALFGQDPLGTVFNGDDNGDGVISMWELWHIADISPIMTSDPQLGDNGALANQTYIACTTPPCPTTYVQNRPITDSETITGCNIQVSNVIILNTHNANVVLDATKNITITGSFCVQAGVTFQAL